MTTPPPVKFFVPGTPAPQGSKRHVGRGILVESSKNVGPWRERVALASHNESTGVFTEAVTVTLEFVMPRPKSAPKRRTPPASKRPDLDKLIRAVLDGITGTIVSDDSLVVRLISGKRIAEIGEGPGVAVEVRAFEDSDAITADGPPARNARVAVAGVSGQALSLDDFAVVDVDVPEGMTEFLRELAQKVGPGNDQLCLLLETPR